jgi:hypothetical protein
LRSCGREWAPAIFDGPVEFLRSPSCAEPFRQRRRAASASAYGKKRKKSADRAALTEIEAMQPLASF